MVTETKKKTITLTGVVNILKEKSIEVQSKREILETLTKKAKGQMFRVIYARVDLRPAFRRAGLFPVLVKSHGVQKCAYDAKKSVKDAGGPVGSNPAIQNEVWLDAENFISYHTKNKNTSLRVPTSTVDTKNTTVVLCGFLHADGTFEKMTETEYYAKCNEFYAPTKSYEVVQAFRKFIIVDDDKQIADTDKSLGFVVCVH